MSELKTKLRVDKELIDDLISKSWLEIDSIQAQLSTLSSESAVGKKVQQVLKNLLTNYYIFVGELENIEVPELPVPQDSHNEVSKQTYNGLQSVEQITVAKENEDVSFEPFEYFTDFDDPTGEPLTDTDLYKV